MRRFSKLKLITLFCLIGIYGCQSGEPEKQPAGSPKGAQEKTAEETDSDAQPQVSATQAKTSKPLSESAGNAEANKNQPIYIVPNRDPREEKNNKEKTDKEKTDQQNNPQDKEASKEPPKQAN